MANVLEEKQKRIQDAMVKYLGEFDKLSKDTDRLVVSVSTIKSLASELYDLAFESGADAAYDDLIAEREKEEDK